MSMTISEANAVAKVLRFLTGKTQGIIYVPAPDAAEVAQSIAYLAQRAEKPLLMQFPVDLDALTARLQALEEHQGGSQ